MTRKCPDCGNRGNVIDSRETRTTVRRIRQCIKCGVRWTTHETTVAPGVLKRVGKLLDKAAANVDSRPRTRRTDKFRGDELRRRLESRGGG